MKGEASMTEKQYRRSIGRMFIELMIVYGYFLLIFGAAILTSGLSTPLLIQCGVVAAAIVICIVAFIKQRATRPGMIEVSRSGTFSRIRFPSRRMSRKAVSAVFFSVSAVKVYPSDKLSFSESESFAAARAVPPIRNAVPRMRTPPRMVFLRPILEAISPTGI